MSPASAQVKTQYGDNVGTLDGIIKAFYDVVTVKKGEKPSYQRDSCLHIPDARCGYIRPKKDGGKALEYLTLKDFHKSSDEFLAKDGFVEQEIGRKVEQFGGIYHVWSTYESRNTADGPVIERGINSIELYNDGTRFWIIGWFYDGESKTNPIPKKYIGY
ncbi:hypothetical protein BC343_09730 [Mucilaginibacter pedocola]|uniref:SnoaL-like domain-containing protein n=1 Tax=Mucilaginibacter pedocola TaxID=1792845 RepID=A0A1S9PBI4_9SPHI|nr:hypothetical protein BC343_09730 [Mucilaginibacter pedocola]